MLVYGRNVAKEILKSDKKVEKIIKQTGLKDVEKKLIKNLSRGYKQRVSNFARALDLRPCICYNRRKKGGVI